MIDKTKLGGALTAFGTAIFGIPAALLLGGATTVPKWLLMSCLVLGLVVQASGHFATALFASNTDAQQQKQLNTLKDTVDDQTKHFEKSLISTDAIKEIKPANPS